MKTLILKKNQLKTASDLLVQGKLVAFPTETVYGLGASVFSLKAVKKVFAVKRRPVTDPLIVHCADIKMVEQVAFLDKRSLAVARKFWPGPLTLVLKKRPGISKLVTAGQTTVAVRIPDHNLTLEFIRSAGVPVVGPSANLFGYTSPTSREHVLADLGGKIDAVLDGGICKIGVESTVLDMTGKKPRVLRPGGLSFAKLKKVLPDLQDYKGKSSFKSPGQFRYHYSPSAEVVLTQSVGKIRKYVTDNLKDKFGIMAYKEWGRTFPKNTLVFEWGKRHDYKVLASRLYKGLRFLDERGVKKIFCPLPKPKDLGQAINNRLKKASGV